MACCDHGVADHQTHDLQTLLSSSKRNFLIRNNGDQVKIASLKGKKVGLYFSASWCGPCQGFTPDLVEVYNELSPNRDFQIVFVSGDEDDESFEEYFSKMPWLAIPFSDSNTLDRVNKSFKVNGIPHLVILDENGNVLTEDGVEIIGNYGVDAYPFTPEKMKEIKHQEEVAMREQSLKSILVSGSSDFVISADGKEVPVSELVGKNILLYFSAHWCPPCRAFLPKLVEAYGQIKAKDDAFEVIFISSDRDQTSFDEFFSKMPWLALPFGDERQASLKQAFKVLGIPTLVALGPTGQTVTTEAVELVMIHGADAYPFTDERVKEIEAQHEEMEAQHEEMAKGWPEKLKHALHEHELELTRSEGYICDGCDDGGKVWSFNCEDCEFYLHPKCAMGEDKGTNGDAEKDVKEGKNSKKGGGCEGDVCYKA